MTGLVATAWQNVFENMGDGGLSHPHGRRNFHSRESDTPKVVALSQAETDGTDTVSIRL